MEIKVEEKKTTKTSGFILPMLGFSRNFYGVALRNVYLGDGEKPEYNEHIMLLFRFTSDPQFTWLDKQLEGHKEFVDRYDVDNGKSIMFVFKVPDVFKDDYNKFKKGKYSQFSPKLKQDTLKLNELTPDSNIYAAFTKGKRLRKYWADKLGVEEAVIDEVLSPPDPREEIFQYKVKEGFPKYEAEEIDNAWNVVFREDEFTKSTICKIPTYYKDSKRIATKIVHLLKNTKLDLSV
jgi:hypothetical protein